MLLIAGHDFKETAGGRCCVTKDYTGTTCNRRWLDIRDACESDIGACGIAHAGSLNVTELRQIEEERRREENVLWEHINGSASSGSR